MPSAGVATINEKMVRRLPGRLHELLSIDRALDDAAGVWTEENCNTFDPPGMQPHRLLLKEGAVVILLRNMRPELGMCNGTRMIVESISPFRLQCRILTEGRHQGRRVTVPRIKLQSHESQLPFTLCRTQ